MVDCITPRSGPRELALVQERFGIRDAAPVVCEPFRQWVIEDHFPAGRPPLEKVGVNFVDDVKSYEIMKLRLLNASHASLCYAAALMGYSHVDQAMADPVLAGWLKALPTRETIPTLEPIEGVEYAAYLDSVLRRFGNPAIADTIARLAQDGSDRQPQFILPTVRDALARSLAIDGFALELAIWMQYCAKPPTKLDDPLAAPLHRAAKHGPEAFLDQREIFGTLGQDPRLRAAVANAWHRVRGTGVRGSLEHYIAS
jgi:mannitol 2-dehydrogenase